MEINHNLQEISVKIVYYGPGLSGKTTNLEIIHAKTPENNRGNLTAISTDQDRTLFFDYMPLEIGRIGNFKVRLRLFTVPGQVYYNVTRKLVLRCADGVVFVADSQESQFAENISSLRNLRENVEEQGDKLEELPVVFQLNKQDLPNLTPMEELAAALNAEIGTDAPYFPAIAVKGDGVFQTLKHVANLTMNRVEGLLRQRPKVKRVVKKPDEVPLAQTQDRMKIKLNPQKPKPDEAGQTLSRAKPDVQQNTPSRGVASLLHAKENPTSLDRLSLLAKKNKPKASIGLGKLFQGSLSQSKPSKGQPGQSASLSNTPPGGTTPLSSPSLKAEPKTRLFPAPPPENKEQR